jgi:transposase
MYDRIGRPSIPPEHLLKAMLLQSFYSIRSERQLCERLRYDLLFKWFLGLNITDDVFDHSTFSKNRDRLLQHEVAAQFFAAVREEARRRRLLSLRPLHGRWHAAGRVGVDEERPAARRR